jgi:glycosyltransferase involved in cell wall biosynthesis
LIIKNSKYELNEDMDRIVFINQWASYLTKDIVNIFADKFDNIGLIAGAISKTGNPLNNKVRITRIKKYNKKSYTTRLISWIIATLQVFILVNTKFRKYHLFITSNPPTLAFITLLYRNSYSVQVLDLYPDGLVAGGFISKKSWVNKLWERRNRKFLTGARNVFTITEGMARSLSRYCSIEKIRVIPQWSSSDGYVEIERSDNKFIQAHSLEDYFIVMYSGNIGLGHHVDILIEAAKKLKEYNEVLFIIAGEGISKQKIEKLIEEYKLKNCRLFSHQSPDMFKHSLQATDIGVVSISKEGAQLCVPIKTYNLINSRLPLLCITDEGSELAILVSKYDIGKCFTPEQVNEISDFIISLKTDKELYYRYKNNLERCSVNFTSENAKEYLVNFKK